MRSSGLNFGRVPATAAVLLVSATGIAALWFLVARGWFLVWGGWRRGVVFAALLSTALAAVVIGVDFSVGIDIANVPPPWSLAFYPVMALVVEMVFHALPLALLLAGSSVFRLPKDVSIWIALAVVSLIEPAFQIADASGGGWLVAAYVWLQVWAVNAAQLYVFRQFGFASMYLLRIVYYLHWHIAWGALRLTL